MENGEPAATDLISSARGGDMDALERLIAMAAPTVRGRLDIAPHWQPQIEADDIMQVAFIEAFLQFGRFLGTEMVAFEAWLTQIARHNLQDAIRGLERKKRPPVNRRLGPEGIGDSCVSLCEMAGVTTTTPSRVLARDEARNLIEKALRQLPESYEQAIRLFDLEGLGGPEVAERMGCSRAAAFMLRARGRERLRDVLGGSDRFFSGPS